MGDYIRGKKTYTKWDAESENIDIEYRPDSQKTLLQEGWLSGTKGKIIKVLLLILLFCTGIIVGFIIRRNIKEIDQTHHRSFSNEFQETKMKSYAFTIENNLKLQNEIHADSIRTFLKNYTSEHHIAGKRPNKKYVDYLVDMWRSWGIENVRVEKFTVLLSYPSSNHANRIRMVDTKSNSLVLIASEVGDDELHPDLRPYLAYSPNKSAQGKLVFANYGRKEDFDYLVSQNISLNGSIIIMKMGKIHQSNKVKFAEENDAAGVLLYPDPADYVNNMTTYPDGLGLPGDSVIRGSLNSIPGNPQSSIQGTSKKASRLETWKLQLPEIPVQPISYNNALKFMSKMAGPKVPETWNGGLDMIYHLGPGHALNDTFEVTMEVFNELKEASIHNVIGNIKGKFEPDRYVIVGNHHDSWTNGSGDPGTGLAIFLEVVHAFSKLKESGWKPSRTLIFASWDAEEFGMIGSAEWLKLHEKELHARAVAYINTDGALEGRDNLLVLGSPLLQQAVSEAAKLVSFPRHDAFNRMDTLINHLAATSKLSHYSNGTNLNSPRLLPLGSDSDYASFMGMHGISSVHLQFESKNSDLSYKLYHSAYDNFDAVEKFVDPGFNISQSLARYLATLAQMLSDSFVLPVNPEDYGKAVSISFKTFQEEYGKLLSSKSIGIVKMGLAVDSFLHTCKGFHNNFTAVNMDDESLGYHEYNDRAIELERSLIMTDWEVYHLAHRHAIFGPHPYNAKEGVAFPHLLGALLTANSSNTDTSWQHVEYQIAQVTSALNSARMVLSSDVLTNQGELISS